MRLTIPPSQASTPPSSSCTAPGQGAGKTALVQCTVQTRTHHQRPTPPCLAHRGDVPLESHQYPGASHILSMAQTMPYDVRVEREGRFSQTLPG